MKKALPLFNEISSHNLAGFRHHLWVIYSGEGMCHEKLRNFFHQLESHGVPEETAKIDLEKLQASLAGNMGENAFFGLTLELIKTTAVYDKKLDNPKEKGVFDNYKKLVFSILKVVLDLFDEELDYPEGQHYNSARKTGLDAARLFLRKDIDLFRKLPQLSYDPYKTRFALREYANQFDDIPPRLGAILNILNRFYEETGPINRQRRQLLKKGVAAKTVKGCPDYKKSHNIINLDNTNISDEEISADQAKVEYVVDNDHMAHDEVLDKVIDLQTADNRYYSYELTKRHMRLSTSYRRASPETISNVLKLCHNMYYEELKKSPVPRFEYLMFVLSVVMSRPAQLIVDGMLGNKKDLDFSFTRRKSKWYLCYNLPIPRNTAPAKPKDTALPDAYKDDFFNHEISEKLLLPIPDKWQEAFKIARKAKDYKYDFSIAIKNINRHLHHPVTQHGSSEYVSFALKQMGVDPYMRAVISADDPFDNAAMYYTQVSPILFYQYHQAVMGELGLDNLDYGQDINRLLLSEDERIFGSMVVPKSVRITELFSALKYRCEKKKIITLHDVMEQHNDMALYTYLVLNLATGHRPTVSPYSSPKYIDLRGKWIFIADKNVISTKKGRMVPLAELAVKQLHAYETHLQHLLVRLRAVNGNRILASQVEACLDPSKGDYPYLFVFPQFEVADLAGLSDQKIARKYYRVMSISPKRYNEALRHEFPTQPNWTRHYSRTVLTNFVHPTVKLSGELIDAFMGHGQFGAHPDSPVSGFRQMDFDLIRQAIDIMFEKLDIDVCAP